MIGQSAETYTLGSHGPDDQMACAVGAVTMDFEDNDRGKEDRVDFDSKGYNLLVVDAGSHGPDR